MRWYQHRSANGTGARRGRCRTRRPERVPESNGWDLTWLADEGQDPEMEGARLKAVHEARVEIVLRV